MEKQIYKRDWADLNIDVSRITKEQGYAKCPVCTPHRKKEHQKLKTLSVDTLRCIFNCHHCGWSGSLFVKQEREYKKPDAAKIKLDGLSEKIIEFFNQRGINNQTIKDFKIGEARTRFPQKPDVDLLAVCFNYYQNDELVNIKYRGPKKIMKMYTGAKKILYNIDCLKNLTENDEVVIVEGEPDCMIVHQSGHPFVLSVPNGATEKENNTEYLDDAIELLAKAKHIILWTDNDVPGNTLAIDLSRRLGKNRCKFVKHLKDCKDANQVHNLYGAEKVLWMIQNAELKTHNGIANVTQLNETLLHVQKNGIPEGWKTGWKSFDNNTKLRPGKIGFVTGPPTFGKSTWLNALFTRCVLFNDLKGAILAMEKDPWETWMELLMIYYGRVVDNRQFPNQSNIEPQEVDYFSQKMQDRVILLDSSETTTDLDKILQLFEELVKTKGIRFFVLDPWAYIQFSYGKDKLEAISTAISKCKMFAKINDVLLIIVAHPTKLNKINNPEHAEDATKPPYIYPVATLYDISGSADFFNMTDYGWSVHGKNGFTQVHQQKRKSIYDGTKDHIYAFKYIEPTGDFTECFVNKAGEVFTKENYVPLHNIIQGNYDSKVVESWYDPKGGMTDFDPIIDFNDSTLPPF